jgi:hypothetical protein
MANPIRSSSDLRANWPRPGRLLAGIAIGIIAACLMLAGVGAGLIYKTGPLGLIICGSLLWLARYQYRATFGYDLQAARTLHFYWMVFTGLLTINLIAGPLRWPQNDAFSEFAYYVVVSAMLMIGAIATVQHERWARVLHRANFPVESELQWKFSLRELLLAIAAVACFFGGLTATLRILEVT